MDVEANCRKSAEPFCVNDLKIWCASYSGVVADGSPASGGTVVIPDGCMGSQRPRPQLPPTHGERTVNIVQARSDLKQCQSMQSTAQTCCGNPASCGGKNSSDALQKLEDAAQDAQQDGNSDGLKQVCQQAQKAGSASSDLSSSYAGICKAKHLSCSDVCSQMYDNWNKQAATCQGDSCNELANIVAQFKSQGDSCTALTTTEQALDDKATQQAINTRIANICLTGIEIPPDGSSPSPTPTPSPSTEITQQQPQQQQLQPADQTAQPPQPWQQAQASAPPPPASLPVGSSECGAVGNISSCMNCADHPDYPSCGGRSSPSPNQEAQNDSSTNSGPSNLAPNKGNSFNVGDPGTQHQGFSMSQTANNNSASGNSNAQNPYGGMYGASSSGSGFPALDKKDLSGSLLARAQMIAEKKGYNTDIFKGERSGSGYTGRTGSGFEGSRRIASFGSASGTSASSSDGRSFIGLDLKRYLPGGGLDPRRGLAGASSGMSEIGPMSTDMFQRISMRFKLICVRHQMLDCD